MKENQKSNQELLLELEELRKKSRKIWKGTIRLQIAAMIISVSAVILCLLAIII